LVQSRDPTNISRRKRRASGLLPQLASSAVPEGEAPLELQARVKAFRQTLEQYGWSEGRNIHIDIRFSAIRSDEYQALAKEMVALQADVIFGHTTPVVVALQRESRTVPIVFVNLSDPLGSGLVTSLAHPGGNITGLMLYEEGITGK
jgi:putative ABC transport system substrate-binding protein